MNALAARHVLPGDAAQSARRWLADAWQAVYFGALLAVLALSPSSYGRAHRLALARRFYQDTAPILPWFTALCALFSLVLTHIVVTTASSYGLSRYALQMVIRLLVLELIPLTAALFVALRCTLPDAAELALMRRDGELASQRRAGQDPVRQEVLPRAVAGILSTLMLAALSCVVASLLAYLAVYGFTLAGFALYTRLFGQVFSSAVVLIFSLKVLFFSLAVSLMPMAAALHGMAGGGRRAGGAPAVFAAILLIDVVSLLGNYY